MGRAVALDRDCTEIERLPSLSRVPEARLLARGRHLPAFQLLPETERMQDARSIGPDLDTCADLLELGRLLVDSDLQALTQERKRNGQASNAAADDDNPARGCLFHALRPNRPLRPRPSPLPTIWAIHPQ